MSSNCNDNIVDTFDSEVLQHRPCKNLPCNIIEPLKAERLFLTQTGFKISPQETGINEPTNQRASDV